MEIIVRASVIFAVLLLLTRGLKRRTLGDMAPFELLLLVSLGDIIQQGITQEDYSLTGAVLAVSTFAFWITVLSFVTWRWRRVANVIDGVPLVIVHDGRLDRAHVGGRTAPRRGGLGGGPTERDRLVGQGPPGRPRDDRTDLVHPLRERRRVRARPARSRRHRNRRHRNRRHRNRRHRSRRRRNRRRHRHRHHHRPVDDRRPAVPHPPNPPANREPSSKPLNSPDPVPPNQPPWKPPG